MFKIHILKPHVNVAFSRLTKIIVKENKYWMANLLSERLNFEISGISVVASVRVNKYFVYWSVPLYSCVRMPLVCRVCIITSAPRQEIQAHFTRKVLSFSFIGWGIMAQGILFVHLFRWPRKQSALKQGNTLGINGIKDRLCQLRSWSWNKLRKFITTVPLYICRSIRSHSVFYCYCI